MRHLLLSQTLGGYPGANIAAAAKYFYEKCSFSPECSPEYPLHSCSSVRLCKERKKGLSILPDGDDSETALMAKVCYCLYYSCLNRIRFIRARDEKRFSDAVTYAKAELETAKEMLSLMNKNAAIGYEAANHYYFSKGQLAEKIINCNYIINRFTEKTNL